MQVLSVMVYALIVITAVILVCLILMQPSKSGGLGSSFGGGGATEAVFGAHALCHLSKLTVIFISVFFVLTLAMAVLAAHTGKPEPSSLMGGTEAVVEETAVVEEVLPPVPQSGAVSESVPSEDTPSK